MSWVLECHDDVVVIRMNSNRLNLMNDVFFDDLNRAFDLIERRYEGRPVVLTSAERVFSAGLDINYCYRVFSKKNTKAAKEWYRSFRGALVRVFEFERPVIAAVNGHAIGGGFLLALCCDHRVCGDADIKFALNAVSVGFPLPAFVSEIVKYSVGEKAAEEMVYNSRFYSPSEVVELGVFHEVMSRNDLMDRAINHARKYVYPGGIRSYARAKKVLRLPALDRMERVCERLDEELPSMLCSDSVLESLRDMLEGLKKER